MVAYNSLWVRNLFIREKAADALRQNYLDSEEWDRIKRKYPVHFYSPNFFIRIGLFILTTVILLFSFGLFALLFAASPDRAIAAMAIFFAIVLYAALEYIVQTKNHFQSGIDDALLWISAGLLFGGINYLTNAGDLANCMIIFIVSLYCSLRFADRVFSAVCYISLLGIFFFACRRLGPAAKNFLPFVMIAISFIIYLLVKAAGRLKISQPYHRCLQIISIAALLSFYFSGNFYVVRESSNAIFNLNLAENENIPAGWFFWVFTLLIPCFYITWGIRNKDILLMRVGLLLVAIIIFTVRYYYQVGSIEVVMTSAGILLVLISYALTRNLKTSKYGFTSQDSASAGTKEMLELESILLAQTFTDPPASSDATRFGGGSFGGGGASGEF